MAVALVTGTSSGIGLATALHFGRQGHDVWAGVRQPAAATDLRAAIDAERLPVRIVALDVDEPGSIQRGVADVLDKPGRVDILVINAGIGGGRSRTFRSTGSRRCSRRTTSACRRRYGFTW